MGVHLLTYQITDEGGKTRNVVLPVPDTYTVVQAQAFTDVFLDKLDNAIGGIITKAAILFNLSLSGMAFGKGTPVADHPVKHGGLLGFAVNGSVYRHSIYIPTYLQTLIDENQSIANAGASAALITSILSGEAVISVSDLHENDLITFLSGRGVDRK